MQETKRILICMFLWEHYIKMNIMNVKLFIIIQIKYIMFKITLNSRINATSILFPSIFTVQIDIFNTSIFQHIKLDILYIPPYIKKRVGAKYLLFTLKDTLYVNNQLYKQKSYIFRSNGPERTF
eukprot:48791_1